MSQILIPKYGANSYPINIESMGGDYVTVRLGVPEGFGTRIPGYFNIVNDATGYYIESYTEEPKYEIGSVQ